MTDESDPFGKPLRHLPRICPPWTDHKRTACGRPLDDVASVVTWEEGRRLYREHGRARAAFLFCQTCVGQQRNVERPNAWNENPAAVVADYTRQAGWSGDRDGGEVRAELLALADLVAAHPEEYAAHVHRRRVPDVLAAQRRKRRKT